MFASTSTVLAVVLALNAGSALAAAVPTPNVGAPIPPPAVGSTSTGTNPGAKAAAAPALPEGGRDARLNIARVTYDASKHTEARLIVTSHHRLRNDWAGIHHTTSAVHGHIFVTTFDPQDGLVGHNYNVTTQAEWDQVVKASGASPILISALVHTAVTAPVTAGATPPPPASGLSSSSASTAVPPPSQLAVKGKRSMDEIRAIARAIEDEYLAARAYEEEFYARSYGGMEDLE